VNKVRFLSNSSSTQHLDPSKIHTSINSTTNHFNSDPTPQNANILFVYGIDKAVDIYRIRPIDDKKQRQRRRFKRYKEKLAEMKIKLDEKKITTQMYKDTERDLPPIFLPTDDLEVCAPFRLEERMTNFSYFNSKTTHSIIPNKKALQNSTIKKTRI
jgi:hypothetical protein